MATEQYIALIIDDDSTATSELRKGLAAHPEFTVAGSASTATAGEQLLFRLRPDILFLDVELPDMQGVAFLNAIKERIDWRMSVVFYSMHSKYILSALREAAFDYLLKPFEQEELDGIISRYKENISKPQPLTAQQPQQGNALKNCFLAATITGYRMIHVEEIGYFEHKGLRKQWHAHLSSGESLCLKRGTSAETILGYSPAFIQISQSCIVNANCLAMICGNECKLYPPFDKADKLTISRNYLKKLQETLNFI